MGGLSDGRTVGLTCAEESEYQSDGPTVRQSAHQNLTCICTTPRLLSSCTACSRKIS